MVSHVAEPHSVAALVLQLDNAGWHGPENLAVPDGIRLVFQPVYSPELQPAEHLWAFVDQPLINRYFDSMGHLDQPIGQRRVALTKQQDLIRDSTLFHWWWLRRRDSQSAVDIPQRQK